MTGKIALITGIAGQDGSYLSEHLLSLGYEVHGIVRRNSVPEHQESRINHLEKNVQLHYGDITDQSGLAQIVKNLDPELIFNLAAQSHVRISFEVPIYTSQVNALGVLGILETVRQVSPEARYYQASSSEMFGDSVDSDGYQRETTPMTPVSPYGIAKLFGYHTTRNYRSAYGLHASNGILFNHESPRRGSNFVTSKIIKTACQIKLGQAEVLELGNLDSQRDWGHSRDYVRAMVAIVNQDTPDDFVISTGETRSVRDLVSKVFSSLDLDYSKYVKFNPRFARPQELEYLCGDSTKARNVLGWTPEVSFDELVEEMVEVGLRRVRDSN